MAAGLRRRRAGAGGGGGGGREGTAPRRSQAPVASLRCTDGQKEAAPSNLGAQHTARVDCDSALLAGPRRRPGHSRTPPCPSSHKSAPCRPSLPVPASSWLRPPSAPPPVSKPACRRPPRGSGRPPGQPAGGAAAGEAPSSGVSRIAALPAIIVACCGFHPCRPPPHCRGAPGARLAPASGHSTAPRPPARRRPAAGGRRCLAPLRARSHPAAALPVPRPFPQCAAR